MMVRIQRPGTSRAGGQAKRPVAWWRLAGVLAGLGAITWVFARECRPAPTAFQISVFAGLLALILRETWRVGWYEPRPETPPALARRWRWSRTATQRVVAGSMLVGGLAAASAGMLAMRLRPLSDGGAASPYGILVVLGVVVVGLGILLLLFEPQEKKSE